MSTKPLILLTNDDGYRAAGLQALRGTIQELAEVVVVAPSTEKSAVSHGLTLNTPLRIEKIEEGLYAVDGTPADCVLVAMNKILSARPAMVVSGINAGANIGDDINYSGTVAGAREGSMYGLRSVAFSLAFSDRMDYGPGAAWAARVARVYLESGLNEGVFLNVNFPPGEPGGVKITRQSGKFARSSIYENNDPRGKKYYWIGEDESSWDASGDTDFFALTHGFVSITPLHRDQTAHHRLADAARLFATLGDGWSESGAHAQ